MLTEIKNLMTQKVLPFFERFENALRDRAHRLDVQTYFKHGWEIDDNPPILMLHPKANHEYMCAIIDGGEEAFQEFFSDVFLPCNKRWRKILELMGNRYGQIPELRDFAIALERVMEAYGIGRMNLKTGRSFYEAPIYQRYEEMSQKHAILGDTIRRLEQSAAPLMSNQDILYTDREVAKDYLRDLAQRMKNANIATSLRKIVSDYMVGNGDSREFAEEVSRAKTLIERWGWEPSTINRIVKPSQG